MSFRSGAVHLMIASALSMLLTSACADRDGPVTTAGAGEVQLREGATLGSMVDRSVTGKVRSVFVKYQADAPANRVALARNPGSVRFSNDLLELRTIAMEVAIDEVDRVAEELRKLAWVQSIEIGTDDSRLIGSTGSFLYTDTVPWGVSATYATWVHSLTGNHGDGIKVGVLDGGMNCSHPDLSGRVVGGYDYIAGTSGAACVEYIHHGTAVAGIIGATINDQYVMGMAPEVDVYSVAICDANGDCTDARMASGLNWARNNGMDIINWSIANCGEDLVSTVEFALQQAVVAGIVVVAGAGNGTLNLCLPSSPVSAFIRESGVIGVSSLMYGDTVPTGYQYGSHVDVAAPAFVRSDSASNKTAIFGNNSSAVPHVTGTAALLLAAGVSPANVESRITTNARDLGAPGKDNYFGYGALNTARAVIPGPQIAGWTYCTTGVIYAGTCTVYPNRQNGIPAMEWRWQITYSNNILPSIDTSWVSDTAFTITVPDGSYAIDITATVREHASFSPGFGRQSLPSYLTLRVCPSDSEDLRSGRGEIRSGRSNAQRRNGNEEVMAICPE